MSPAPGFRRRCESDNRRLRGSTPTTRTVTPAPPVSMVPGPERSKGAPRAHAVADYPRSAQPAAPLVGVAPGVQDLFGSWRRRGSPSVIVFG